MCVPQPSAAGPIHSHARCHAWRATARCAAPAVRAESPLRRSRDPLEQKPAAAAVAPVRRAVGESHPPTPALLSSRSGSHRSGEPRVARHVRRRSDDVWSHAWPDRWDSDRFGHRRTPREWNYCPRSRATNQSGRRARANPRAQSGSAPSHTPASCQLCRRRQHVIPDPHPSSAGSICQGMRCEGRRQCRSDTRDPRRAAVRLLLDGVESASTDGLDPTMHLEAAWRAYPLHATSPTGSGFGGFVTRSKAPRRCVPSLMQPRAAGGCC